MSLPFTSPLDVRPDVAAFEAYEPGLSIEEIQQRYGLERVIKLASNENPLGVSPAALAAMARRAPRAHRYPAAGNPRLRQALGRHCGVDPARIVIGNGSDEIIDLLFRIRAVPGVHNAVAFRPCFGLYVTQARMAGVELRRVHLKKDFSFDFDTLISRADSRTTLAFVTSPDNPSGFQASVPDLITVAHALPPTCLLVVDEAYAEFAPEGSSLLSHLDSLPNVALLRTFSKVYGLAGLRVGYGILPAPLADYYWRVRLPFSLNVMAEEAALAALEDQDFVTATVDLVTRGRALLSSGLAALGCRVLPSQANFIMFSPPAEGPSASDLHHELLKRGFILRSLGGYHLPDWLRLTVGTDEENKLLLDACAQIFQGIPA